MFTGLKFTATINLANGNYEKLGTTIGMKVNNFYNASGFIYEQDAYLTPTILIKDFFNVNDASYNRQSYVNGTLITYNSYNVVNKLITSILYKATGTILQTDNYTYNSTGLTNTKISFNAAGTFIDNIHYGYTSTNKLNDFTHTDLTGRITEINYFINGIFDHTTKFPVVVPVIPIVVTPTTPVVLTKIHVMSTVGWSNIDGFGEINVLSAINSVTGKHILDTVPINKHDWGMLSTHFDDVHSAGYTGKGIVIADIDTGIDLKNAALTHNLSQYNWNFITNTANVQDDNKHGSFTAGELIAKDVGNGVIGGAYDSQLMVLKTLDANGNGATINTAKAITYAVDHGANIINLSMGSVLPQPAIFTALQYAQSHNVLVSVASGNNLGSSPTYPAVYAENLDNIFAVGASWVMGGKLGFASFANKTGSNSAYNYVVAPGNAVLGYDQNGNVILNTGTSMAAPLVAAEMALLSQAYNEQHPAGVSLIQFVAGAIDHNTDMINIVGGIPYPVGYVFA